MPGKMQAMLSVIAICLGASLGAVSRWGLALWLSPGGLIPWGTLAANLLGGYLIGVAIAVLQSMPQIDPVWTCCWSPAFWADSRHFRPFRRKL